MKPRPWTEAELDVVRSRYAHDGATKLAVELGRTRQAITQKAHALGCARKPRWTPESEAHLRLLWEGLTPPPAIAKKLQRTLDAVCLRASRLGLDRGVPRGFESIACAAQRTGLCEPTLRRVLRWAGVARTRTMSRTPGAMRRHSRSYVDPYDVDQAVARWVASETISAAAKARGVCGESLRAWLSEAGALPQVRRGAPLRIASAEIDRVIGERQERRAGLRSVSAEARRTGVPVVTLCRWLHEAQVPRVGVRPWLVDPATVDQVIAERKQCSMRPQAAE